MFMRSDVTHHVADDLSRMIHIRFMYVSRVRCLPMHKKVRFGAHYTYYVACISRQEQYHNSFVPREIIRRSTPQHGSSVAHIDNDPACPKCQPRAQLLQLLCRRRSRAVDHGNISRLGSNYNLYLAVDPQHAPCTQAQEL